MALTVAVSHGARRLLMSQNIYTMKLERRGHYIPEALQANAHLVHHVGDMVIATAVAIPAAATTTEVNSAARTSAPAYFVLREAQEVVGVLPTDWLAASLAAARSDAEPIVNLARRDFVVVSSATTIFELIASMQRAKAEFAVILATDSDRGTAGDVRGVITRAHLAEALAEGMAVFSD